MPLDPNQFSIHDIRELPFVLFNQEAAEPGYARVWAAEMAALMKHGRPFVVVYEQLARDETHEDRKERAVWLKNHKTALAGVCKALVSIEPNEAHRAAVRAMGQTAVKAFGIPHEVVATREDAKVLVRQLTTPVG